MPRTCAWKRSGYSEGTGGGLATAAELRTDKNRETQWRRFLQAVPRNDPSCRERRATLCGWWIKAGRVETGNDDALVDKFHSTTEHIHMQARLLGRPPLSWSGIYV